MLLQKHIDEIGQLVRLLEAREEEVLLQFLVIILDEIANDLRRFGDRLRRQIFVRVHATERLAVNEQDALQHAMFAHQVLRRRDLVVLLFFLFREQVARASHEGGGDDDATGFDEFSAAGLVERFHVR